MKKNHARVDSPDKSGLSPLKTESKLYGAMFVKVSIIILLFMALYAASKAAVRTSVANGNWSSASTWDCSCVPATTDDIVIASGTTVTLTADATIGAVTINAGGTLNNDIYVLTATGVYTVNGTHSGSGNIELNGTGPALNMDGTGNITNTGFLNINHDRDILSSANLTISSGTLKIIGMNTVSNYGIVNLSGNIDGTTSSSYWYARVNSRINIAGTIFATTGAYQLVPSETSTINYNNSGNQDVKIGGKNVIINGAGTKTLKANMTIYGDLTIDAGAELDVSVNNYSITLQGQWINNGTFNPRSGTVTLSGSGSPTVAGSFYNLTLNMSSGSVSLSNNVSASDTLTMTAGDINLNGYTFTLGTSVANKGTLSRTAGTMYGGTFKRWFDTSLLSISSASGLFPLGTSGDYRAIHVGVTSAPAAGGTISAIHNDVSGATDVSFDDPTDGVGPPPTGNVLRITNASWTLLSGDGLTGGTYDLRIEGTNNGSYQIGSLSDLRLTRVADVAGTHSAATGTTTAPLLNRTGLSLTELNSTFYMGSVDISSSSLPVQLQSFKAEVSGNNVTLKWVTASELNNSHFEVERSRMNQGWAYVTSLPSQNPNSHELLSYEAKDSPVEEGVYFYRLKLIDLNGNFSYSTAVEVALEKSGYEFSILSAYLNANTKDLIMNIALPNDDKVNLMIFDMTGRKIYGSFEEFKAGKHSLQFNAANYPSGMYLFVMSSQAGSASYKFLIMH